MTQDPNSFEDNVKKAFNKVKEDISSLKSEIELIKASLNEIKKEIKKNTMISSGNDGVLRQTYDKLTTEEKHHKALKEAVKDLNAYFEEAFKS